MTDYKPTMTVHELYLDLKRCGVRTSKPKIQALIKQGKYPFAVSCEMKSDEFEIYTKPYEEWKEDKGLHYIN